MKSTFLHTNINVFDLNKSIQFYSEALGLHEMRRIEIPDGSFIIVYLGDTETDHLLELTWLRDRKEPYNLGDNEWHIAFHVDDRNAAFLKHQQMGCICYENKEMDLYFIADPDGYWLEIL
ncbi:MAG: VOC family protein [Clostridiales bacterium]|nr:VOC family protein [Clostridiales bacterium]